MPNVECRRNDEMRTTIEGVAWPIPYSVIRLSSLISIR
jgi:hypothetical protein